MLFSSLLSRQLRLFLLPCFAMAVGSVYAQENTDEPFNGIISDFTGSPLKGAKVWTHDDRRYATSDKKGRFGLTNVQGTDTLHVRYKKVNYDIPVNGKKSARIRLANENPFMEEDQELVDIGYGFVSKRECTISRGGISGEELVRTGKTFLLDALQGKVAGLYISNGKALIRGINSINASTEPLYIVDNVIVSDLDMVSIYDVDYVEVMKDAGIYGSRGANGAIIVRTKK